MTDNIRTFADAAFYAEWLKRRIEGLSDEPPMWSRTAYTSRHTLHVIFRNDGYRPEDMQARKLPDRICDDTLGDKAQEVFEAVRAYALSIRSRRLLVWRAEPEIAWKEADPDNGLNAGYDIYLRLCFETWDPAVPAQVLKEAGEEEPLL